MKRIKEKPRMGKPKEKPKSAGIPKRAARMMKEKYIRELERRPSGTEGEGCWASDQVEQSGRWAVGELAGTVYDRATRQGREHARKQADQAEAQPGDLAFYPDDSHVGIIVGRNEAGKLLVCHCSSGQNNVVVTEFSASGFTAVGRPDIFD